MKEDEKDPITQKELEEAYMRFLKESFENPRKHKLIDKKERMKRKQKKQMAKQSRKINRIKK